MHRHKIISWAGNEVIHVSKVQHTESCPRGNKGRVGLTSAAGNITIFWIDGQASMRRMLVVAVCLGAWFAAFPAFAQTLADPHTGPKGGVAREDPNAKPAPTTSQKHAETTDDLSHDAMVEEQERRDREEQAERDRDDQASLMPDRARIKRVSETS